MPKKGIETFIFQKILTEYKSRYPVQDVQLIQICWSRSSIVDRLIKGYSDHDDDLKSDRIQPIPDTW